MAGLLVALASLLPKSTDSLSFASGTSLTKKGEVTTKYLLLAELYTYFFIYLSIIIWSPLLLVLVIVNFLPSYIVVSALEKALLLSSLTILVKAIAVSLVPDLLFT